MKHEDYWELLNAYVDGELSNEKRIQCERHLFQCPQCQEDYRQITAWKQAMKQRNPQKFTEPLPLALDLKLTAMAEAFVREDNEVQSGAKDWIQELAMVGHWINKMKWRVISVALLILSTMLGMSFFAYQEGEVPQLSTPDRHVSALNGLGNRLLKIHLEYKSLHRDEPPYHPETLAFLFQKHIDYAVSLPEQPFGMPVDGRVIRDQGTNLPMIRYQMGAIDVSLFELPISQTLELFSSEREDQEMCWVPPTLKCFDNGAGESLCLQDQGPLTRIWVATMSKEELKYCLEHHSCRPDPKQL